MIFRDKEGSYNVITFLMLFPLVLFLILFLIAVQQHFYIRNNINDITSSSLDIILTSGGIGEDFNNYIDEILEERNIDRNRIEIRASSTDPDCSNAICSGDRFVKRGHIISFSITYKFDSMLNPVMGIVGVGRNEGLDSYTSTVHGMSQRWRKVEHDRG